MNSKAQQPKESQLVTQRKPVAAKQATVGDILQRYQTEILQRQSMDEEEEPLQGKFSPIQLKGKNHTGLSDNLKQGVENLSGYNMDDVRVHYNSSKPAQLHALAYAQGTDIHIGPGQENHLPHEAWHVVQQKQGRVQPTLQLQGVNVNDDDGLEQEADVMGRAAAMNNHPIVQRAVPGGGTPFKQPPNTYGAYNAQGNAKTKLFDKSLYPRGKFGFGSKIRETVLSRFPNLKDSNGSVIAVQVAEGRYVNVAGVQLDHSISWDTIADTMHQHNDQQYRAGKKQTEDNYYTLWDARMYYNDVENLQPTLGANNASAGRSGVQPSTGGGSAGIIEILVTLQGRWMALQQYVDILGKMDGMDENTINSIGNRLLNISESIGSFNEDIDSHL